MEFIAELCYTGLQKAGDRLRRGVRRRMRSWDRGQERLRSRQGRLCPSCMVQGQHRQAAAIHRHCAVHGGTHSSFRQEPLCSPHGDTLHIAANRPLLGGRHGRRRLLKTRRQRHFRHAAGCPSADSISCQKCRKRHHFKVHSRGLSQHGF